MSRLKHSAKRFALTTATTLVLAVVGFQTAFGTTHPTPIDPAPQAAAAQPPAVQACGTRCVSSSGWVRPVDAPVWGGFHNASNPAHEGVDLGADRGTPIRAAAAGTVVRVRCNVTPESWGCDQDGGSNIGGCGWYVDIAHSGGVYTRYCHMVQHPDVAVGQDVTAGQVIGISGSSGNSGRPHLHFEVHKGSEDYNAVDPVAFMADHDAPLGTD